MRNERMRTEKDRHRIRKIMALPNKTGNDASGDLTSGLRCPLPIFPASFACRYTNYYYYCVTPVFHHAMQATHCSTDKKNERYPLSRRFFL